jgi:hypothetical protein
MNNKGQTVLTVFFVLLAFWTVWIFFIAPFINVSVAIAMDSGNITGLSALILTNLNLIIGFLSLVVLFWAARSGMQ